MARDGRVARRRSEYTADQTPDPDILVWCEEHQFTLVTNNRRTMPVHFKDHLAASRRCYGIFILNKKMSLSQTVETLALYWLAESRKPYRSDYLSSTRATLICLYLHPPKTSDQFLGQLGYISSICSEVIAYFSKVRCNGLPLWPKIPNETKTFSHLKW